jgi:hypothetical protein
VALHRTLKRVPALRGIAPVRGSAARPFGRLPKDLLQSRRWPLAKTLRAHWRVRLKRELRQRGLIVDAEISDGALQSWATSLGVGA